MSEFNRETLEQHTDMILDAINDGRITEEMVRDGEVHNEVFNTDYFIIGYAEANEWIEDNFRSTFEAIAIVQEYEMDNFGESNTDVDSEKIANMLSYICGEQVVGELGDFDSVEELKELLLT